MKLLLKLSIYLGLAVAIALPTARAAKKSKPKKAEQPTPVNLFDAMEAGEIEVKYIPKDATEANILITNKTKKPMSIKLPDAFAGVPVLKQDGDFGGGGGGGGGGGAQAGGGGGGGGGGGDFGGGLNVSPERVRKVKVATVCLEHGKPDPSPRIPYKIVPIHEFTTDLKVIEVCKILGQKKVSQNIAQAAAWHLTDKLGWAELAAKDRRRGRYVGVEKYFSHRELQFAMKLVNAVEARVQKSLDQSKSDSLSSQ